MLLPERKLPMHEILTDSDVDEMERRAIEAPRHDYNGKQGAMCAIFELSDDVLELVALVRDLRKRAKGE